MGTDQISRLLIRSSPRCTRLLTAFQKISIEAIKTPRNNQCFYRVSKQASCKRLIRQNPKQSTSSEALLFDRKERASYKTLHSRWPVLLGAVVLATLLWFLFSKLTQAKSLDKDDVIIRRFSEDEREEYANQMMAETLKADPSLILLAGPENDHWIPQDNMDNGGYQQQWTKDLPVVFVITPTYFRPLQRAELTRLSQTFRLVPNLHWILVEDSEAKTLLVTRFLTKCGIRYTHLNVRTNEAYRDYIKKLPRGVDQRNIGLQWLRNAIEPGSVKGVVYFADDDNVYDIALFEKIRWTKSVSVFPVGWTGLAKWSGPLCKDGQVLDFHTNYAPQRRFPIDMAGFAVNLNVLLVDKVRAKFKPIRGFIETTFLEQLTTKEEMEGLPHNCSEVLVWHTRTKLPRESLKGENELLMTGQGSDPEVET